MKRSGFTLLETMIALGVVVVGVAAGAQINRVLFIANQQSDDSIQATNLADEGIRLVEMTQQYLRNTTTGSKNLEPYFHLSIPGRALSIIPYALPSNPLTISWCVQTSTADAGATTSACLTNPPSKIEAANNTTQYLGSLLASGDIIAVNRAPSSDGDSRLVIDATTTTGNQIASSLSTWDYYRRFITIQEVSVISIKTTSMYQVTVTVTNVASKLSVQRTVFLTDYAS